MFFFGFFGFMSQKHFHKPYKAIIKTIKNYVFIKILITTMSTDNLVRFSSFGMRGSNKTAPQQHTVRNQPIQGNNSNKS